MTFTTYVNRIKWLMHEKGLDSHWDRLAAFAAATSVGTFVAGAAMIGNVEMDAASNPGLTAALGVAPLNLAGQQDIKHGTTGQILPSTTAVERTPEGNYRTA